MAKAVSSVVHRSLDRDTACSQRRLMCSDVPLNQDYDWENSESTKDRAVFEDGFVSLHNMKM